MTDNDKNKKQPEIEEDLSLDDMMAESVKNSEDPEDTETEVKTADETVETPEETVETPEEVKTKDDVKTTDETVIAPEENSETESEEDVKTLDDTTLDEGEETPEEEKTEETKDEGEKKDAKEEKNGEKADDKSAAKPAFRGKWYIVHTYSGHENKVARTLMQRVQAMGFENTIFDALVPTRDTIRVRGGKKETIKEKIFPGYILVNMNLSDEAWVLVRTTPGVTSFVGAQNKPTPIRDDEVEAIVAFVGQKDPVYKAQFSNGEAVKITDGPFSDFLGTVESIDDAKGKVKVLVSIFGRETPVELDFLQVAKI